MDQQAQIDALKAEIETIKALAKRENKDLTITMLCAGIGLIATGYSIIQIKIAMAKIIRNQQHLEDVIDVEIIQKHKEQMDSE